MNRSAFTMIEVMIALALAGIAGAAAVSVYTLAVRNGGDQGNEWQAVAIAQQQMEFLASAPRTSALLADTVVDGAAPGSTGDRTCASGVDGTRGGNGHVNGLGDPDNNGLFELCWKNTAGSPSGILINTRVIVTYPTRDSTKTIFFQLLR